MNFIRKYPAEVIPLVFDFRRRLGSLAAGGVIKAPVLALEVTPGGELSIGAPIDAMIDELSQLEVAVVATGGEPNSIYACRCRATIAHSGGEYVFDVVLNVFVAG